MRDEHRERVEIGLEVMRSGFFPSTSIANRSKIGMPLLSSWWFVAKTIRLSPTKQIGTQLCLPRFTKRRRSEPSMRRPSQR